MERPHRSGVEVVPVGVGEKHQPQAFDVPDLPQLFHWDAAVNEDFAVDNHGIAAGASGENVIDQR